MSNEDIIVGGMITGTILGLGAMATYAVTNPPPPLNDYQACNRACRNSFTLASEGDKLLKCFENCIAVRNNPDKDNSSPLPMKKTN